MSIFDRPSIWDKATKLAMKHFDSLGQMQMIAQKKKRGTLTEKEKSILKEFRKEGKDIGL